MLQPDAQKIIAIRNARQDGGRELWFYSTIGAAIAAGVPWLTYLCPACQQVGSIDLRTLDRTVSFDLNDMLSCGTELADAYRCEGNHVGRVFKG